MTSVPLDKLLGCPKVIVTHGVYWKEKVDAAGTFTGLKVKDGEQWMDFKVDGSQNEPIVRFLSGTSDRTLRAHLCPPGCGQELAADSILHVVKVQKLEAGKEVGWMTNFCRGGEKPRRRRVGRIEERSRRLRLSDPKYGERAEREEKQEREKGEKQRQKFQRKEEETKPKPFQEERGPRPERNLRWQRSRSRPREEKQAAQESPQNIKKKKEKKEGSSSQGDSGSGNTGSEGGAPLTTHRISSNHA